MPDCICFSLRSHLFKHAGRMFGYRGWHEYHSSRFRIRYRHATSASRHLWWFRTSCRFNCFRAQVSTYCTENRAHMHGRQTRVRALYQLTELLKNSINRDICVGMRRTVMNKRCLNRCETICSARFRRHLKLASIRRNDCIKNYWNVRAIRIW